MWHAARSIWRTTLGLLRIRSVLLVTLMGCATLAWLQLSIGYNVLFLTKVRGFGAGRGRNRGLDLGAGRHGRQVLLPFASDYLGRRPVIC